MKDTYYTSYVSNQLPVGSPFSVGDFPCRNIS